MFSIDFYNDPLSRLIDYELMNFIDDIDGTNLM